MVSPARFTWRTPASTRSAESSIRPLISLAACALRCASERTSPATTAKPLPCSPARAASTAAFSARILVWKAMLSTTPTISPIRRALPAMPCMLCTTSWTATPPRWASCVALSAWRLARSALPAVICTVCASCVMLAAASCKEPACRAVRSDMSAPPAAISPEPVWISSTPWRTEATAADKPVCIRRIAEYSTPISLSPRKAMAPVRSPSAMRSKWAPASFSGRTMLRRNANRIRTASNSTKPSIAAATRMTRSSVRLAPATAAWPCSRA
ncbi:hypothetical protein D3C86_1375150 [compost metagenome]